MGCKKKCKCCYAVGPTGGSGPIGASGPTGSTGPTGPGLVSFFTYTPTLGNESGVINATFGPSVSSVMNIGDIYSVTGRVSFTTTGAGQGGFTFNLPPPVGGADIVNALGGAISGASATDIVSGSYNQFPGGVNVNAIFEGPGPGPYSVGWSLQYQFP
jgi:hypothetical protein